jgi:hypothetical protein
MKTLAKFVLTGSCIILPACSPSKTELKLSVELAEMRAAQAAEQNQRQNLDAALKAEIGAVNARIQELTSLVKKLDAASKEAEAVKINSAVEKEYAIDGAVFIVTKGGESYKLGLVELMLFNDTELRQKLEARKTDQTNELKRLQPAHQTAIENVAMLKKKYDAARDAWFDSTSNDRLKAQMDAAQKEWLDAMIAEGNASAAVRDSLSGRFFFKALPTPVAATKTDADGHFKITLPKTGSYCIAAQASRSVGKNQESYFWVLPLEFDSTTGKATISLNNDNTTSSGNKLSLIQTNDH